jgi:hypothetical protein
MNNAPFKIGDKVVATISNQYLNKGDVYTVKALYEVVCCKRWAVNVGIPCSSDYKAICGCKTIHPIAGFIYHNRKYFALVQPRHESADIAESIIDQARELIGVSETVAPVHQPVNN